ncbi:MAG: hypothetical protein OEY97_08960 [Nitrospirota bacterium]|nr:hypothetical protein [Nitrospirota bacterium]
MFGMSFAGLMATGITLVLFAWGVYMGAKGIMTEAPPFREGGHAPGAKGTFDPLLHPHGGTRKAA